MPGSGASPAAGATWLRPDWPVPDQRPGGLHAARRRGQRAGRFASLNVGAHVQDDARRMSRKIGGASRAAFDLPAEPAWLSQVHGSRVVRPGQRRSRPAPRPTRWSRREAGRVCVIQVADCLPVLFAARDGSVVGAAHAGWRGLAAGVLENTVAALGVPPAQLLAWIGPGIGPAHFEVGPEVREALSAPPPRGRGRRPAFVANARGRWQCDLVALARQRLATLGLTAIHGGRVVYVRGCRELLFAIAATGVSGRMAALIWLRLDPHKVAR